MAASAADGMPPKLSSLIKAYYAATKMKVRASGRDSMPFEIHYGVRQGCAISPTLFNYIIDWILRQALQDYPVAQVGANVHVSGLAYADDIVILSSSYRYKACLKLLIATPPQKACALAPRRPR